MKLSQATAITEAAIDFALSLKNGRDAQYVVPYWVSGAGIGKTTAVKDIAARRKIPAISCRSPSTMRVSLAVACSNQGWRYDGAYAA